LCLPVDKVFNTKQKLPALRREFLYIRQLKKLEAFDQQGKNQKNKTDEKKPESSDGQDAKSTKFSKQTEYAEGDSDPEGNHFGRCKFHLTLL
jgi:hypothetical protein